MLPMLSCCCSLFRFRLTWSKTQLEQTERMATSHLTVASVFLVSMAVVEGCNPSISPRAKHVVAQVEQPWWRMEQQEQQEVGEEHGGEQPWWRMEQQEQQEQQEVGEEHGGEQPWWRMEQQEQQEQQEVGEEHGVERIEQPWWMTAKA